MHHHEIKINHPTRCNNFSSILLDVYVHLYLFRASSRPSSGAQLQWQPLVLPVEHGSSSDVGRGRASLPEHDQQHCYHLTVKPEAATAVVELLMMGVRTPDTCWAVHKRQVINLRSCCIWLVDLFELFWFSYCCDMFRPQLLTIFRDLAILSACAYSFTAWTQQ